VTRCQLALDKMTPFSAALLQRRLVDSKQLHSKSFVHSVPLLAGRFSAPAVRNTVFQVALSVCVSSTWRDTFTSHSTTFSKRPDCRPSLRFSSSIERRTVFHVALHNMSACMQRRFAPTPTPVPRHCMLPAARHFHFTAPTAHPLPTFITLFQADCLPTLTA
jgi:hypothetical protein